ncbi:MAG: ABC transporter permease [Bacteroidales bacterium]|jgi:lipoprotein-releasing system permease protein|nr:ABC transporter permease [Bacteroidales bacterium]
MNLSLFIAWRYFFSKKKMRVINIISLISVIGIAITTMALLVVISVFNGFTTVGQKILSANNPPLIIEKHIGKTFSLDSIPYDRIAKLEKIKTISPIIEENALITFNQNEQLVELKGVDENYKLINNIDSCIVFGKFSLERYGEYSAILGIGVAYNLGLPQNADIMGAFLNVIVPKRENALTLTPEDAFSSRRIIYSGCFQVTSSMDENTIFVPISFARDILNYAQNEVSSIFIAPKKEKDIPSLKKEISEILKDDFSIKDIYEQEPLYQSVVKAERLGVYLILSFIIFIATFNVMGALSLLIMDKRKDIMIMRSMGFSLYKVKSIYFINGLLLSSIGALLGLLLGIIICFIQQKFGIIGVGQSGMVVDSFPIVLRLWDIVSILLLVLFIAFICLWIIISRIKFDYKIKI